MSELTEDPTALLRRAMLDNDEDRKAWRYWDGEHWNNEALREDFEVIKFASPFVVVRRRRDGVIGTMKFINYQRTYFDFRAST